MKVSHEKQCGYYINPYYQVSSHTPMQSLSVSATRCLRSTICLLCATLFSPWSPTPCVLNIIPINPLLPPSPLALPHPSPLVNSSPFWESGSLLLFCSFSFVSLLYFTNEGNHLALVFLCLAYFTEHNILQLHPCCCKWLNNIPLCICTTSASSIHLLMDI